MKIVGFPVDISRIQDPRIVQGARTRQALLQATLDLIQAGDSQPSAMAIAAIAGVGNQDLFRFFQTLDDLYAAAFDLAVSRTFDHTGPVDCAASLSSRIELLVSDRAQLFEEWLPVWHFAERLEEAAPAVGERVSALRKSLRARLADWFTTELSALEPRTRDMVLDSLDAAFGLDSWLKLRQRLRLPAGRASQTWRFAAQTVAMQALAVAQMPTS
jgi:AcrR family transcriptional regulator